MAEDWKARIGSEFPSAIDTPQRGTLWHYTDAAGLMGILGSRAVWATHYAHLNDTSELKFGEALVAKTLESLIERESGRAHAFARKAYERWSHDPLSGDLFVASFCADSGNTLSQWRGYGHFGAGYSVGFRTLGDRHNLLELRYLGPHDHDVEAESVVRRLVERGTQLCDAHPDEAAAIEEAILNRIYFGLGLLAIRSKDRAFAEEHEWRLIFVAGSRGPAPRYRPTPRGIVPYAPLRLAPRGARLDIEAIYVGPSNNSSASVGAVVSYLTSLGYENASELVRPSGIPFRG
jgi:hypothetical protein